MIFGFTPSGSQPLGGFLGLPHDLAVTTALWYLVNGLGWAVDGGRIDIPPGAVIDTFAPQWQWLIGVGPPIDAVPLDQYTYDFMTNNNGTIGLGYPYWGVRFVLDRGIVPITV